MSTLVNTLGLPRPGNMDTRYGAIVEHDVYMICERIKEIDPRLFIVFHPDRDAEQFAVIEKCDDHVDRLVFRADALDARVIGKLQYLLSVPFEQRLAEAEKIEALHAAANDEYQRELAYETIGARMPGMLLKSGGIDSRPLSYPTRGVSGGKGSKAKS